MKLSTKTREAMASLELTFRTHDFRQLHMRIRRMTRTYPDSGLYLDRLRLAVKVGAGEDVVSSLAIGAVPRIDREMSNLAHRRAAYALVAQIAGGAA